MIPQRFVSRTSKHSVSRVWASLSDFLVRAALFHSTLVVHLRTDGRPDPIRSDQHICFAETAIGQLELHPLASS